MVNQVICNQGRVMLAYACKDVSWGYPTHVQCGTGTGTIDQSRTTMFNAYDSPTALSSTTVNESNRTTTFTGTIAFTETVVVKEWALWGTPDAGVTWYLCAHVLLDSAITYYNGDSATYNFRYSW